MGLSKRILALVGMSTETGEAQRTLFSVYVHLRWDGLDYLLLQGWSIDRSHVIREKLTK